MLHLRLTCSKEMQGKWMRTKAGPTCREAAAKAVRCCSMLGWLAQVRVEVSKASCVGTSALPESARLLTTRPPCRHGSHMSEHASTWLHVLAVLGTVTAEQELRWSSMPL